MAKSDISVKLGLNSKEFDDNIKNSKEQINKFKRDTAKGQQDITAGFTNMVKGAGAFGLALVGVNGVSSAFQKLLDSNQKFGDGFAATMGGCQNVFDQFVQYLGRADLSGFMNNITNAFRAGVENAKAIDQLGNTNMSYNVAASNRREQIAEIDAQLSKEKDSAKRSELIDARKSLIADLMRFTTTLNDDTYNVLNTGVGKFLNAPIVPSALKMAFTPDMFTAMSEVDLNESSRDSIKSKADEAYDMWLNDTKDITANIDRLKKVKSDINTGENYRYLPQADKDQMIKELDDEIGKYMMVINEYLATMPKEMRQNLLNHISLNIISDSDLQKLYNDMQRVSDASRLVNRIAKSTPAPPEEYKFNGSGTQGKGNISIKVEVDTEDEYDMTNIDAVWDWEQERNANRRKDSASQALLNSDSFKSISFPFEPKELENIDVNDQINQFTNLATAIGSVTGAVNEGASGWISWGASLLTAIATAIPAISALTAAKKAEANANAEAAVTGAAASVSGIPVVGWLMAGAAVASVVAAMVSIPKFATGGVVGGGSYSGDKIPALLNAGEMVLNDRQQTNLFNQLNSGSGRGGNVNVTGELKLSGSDLIAAVKKNEKLNDRI